ncbi:hypothetical protein HZA56_13595 [Candidatus Poribacteria bacterium]|nr:hypothetical protein [Candidatus Poribacteria bacterium]
MTLATTLEENVDVAVFGREQCRGAISAIHVAHPSFGFVKLPQHDYAKANTVPA